MYKSSAVLRLRICFDEDFRVSTMLRLHTALFVVSDSVIHVIYLVAFLDLVMHESELFCSFCVCFFVLVFRCMLTAASKLYL